MDKQQLDKMLKMLEQEIADLKTQYKDLLEKDSKFPELKEIRIRLKNAEKDLNALKQQTF